MKPVYQINNYSNPVRYRKTDPLLKEADSTIRKADNVLEKARRLMEDYSSAGESMANLDMRYL